MSVLGLQSAGTARRALLDDHSSGGRFRGLRTLCLAACPALAVLSLLLSAIPHFDPFAWTIWGREIVHPDVALSTHDGPSWKPLPVLFTTPLSLLGDAAPAAWLVVSRTAGLLAVVLAYRLGRRLGSVPAGVVAAAALVLVPGLFQELAFGGELGPLLALTLGAVDRHRAGRPAQAMALGFGAALLRVETWPFLLVYGLWTWRTKAVDRRFVAALALLLPALWFVPDWVTSGDPFRGPEVARLSNEAETRALAQNPVLEVLKRAYGLVPLPVLVLAAVAVVVAVLRRKWTVVVLGTAAVAWVAMVAAFTVFGYSGLPRFMVPAAAVVCVLGGVGTARVLELGHRRRLLVAGLIVAVMLPFLAVRSRDLVDQAHTAGAWRTTAEGLEAAVGLAGGPDRVACRHPVINHPALTELAWLLGVPIDRIKTEVGTDSVVFAPADPSRGRPPPVLVDMPRRLLVRTPEWQVYEVGDPAMPPEGCPPRYR